MAFPEQHYQWTWDFASPPAALWPLVSNTDRFNRDCGYPPVTVVPSTSAHRRLRATVMGLVIEWEEHGFEWLEPYRFAVTRTYLSGPVARMRMRCELAPGPNGGTTLTYELRLTPASLLGRLALPFSIGRQARATTERVLRRYDAFAQQGVRMSQLAQRPVLAPGASERLAIARDSLVNGAGQPAELVTRLTDFVTTADDQSNQRIRAYALADLWQSNRRDTLKLCLHATRAGVLDFHWDVMCPHCRGAQVTNSSLGTLRAEAHCATCHLDFTASFDQSVELTFTPNPAIRPVTRTDYCVGGPQVTPHIVAQHLLPPGESRPFDLAWKSGRYRVRSPALKLPRFFRIEAGAAAAGEISLDPVDGQSSDVVFAPGATLTLRNAAGAPLLAIVEHVEWTDQATMAAEVTALQTFRDLFAAEVLRPGGQISVGSLTIVFTDLKDSTQLYREIGDAPAFGRVLTHFEVLKAAIAAEGGAIVKTMGDAVMAVFSQPSAALRALIRAQRHLARPNDFALPPGVTAPSVRQPLALKAGVHHGACIAITQNDRLDYFGTTVNTAARLCALGTGEDLVLSSAVRQDPEVSTLLADPAAGLAAMSDSARLKGLGGDAFEIWRLQSPADLTRQPFWRL